MARGNRSTPEINSGSMADIAFLLLIFFLVTTTIASDKGVSLRLPPKADPNDAPEEIKKNDRNIFKVLVNSSDRVLVNGEPLTDLDQIRPMVKDFVMNYGRDPKMSDNPKEAVVSFKADRGTSYATYIGILDNLKGAYNEIYAANVGITLDRYLSLDRKKPAEKKMYEDARIGPDGEKIPMNISIAEPTKTGGN
ncbi:biopolymer transporter ExbD [Persicobacter diffluens]|uniref:Biopolymer transporter ExbD n=1 Tax=Persicobacter diffluens TaxID=981 RepID=A0AAN5AKD0_9BACT|nr:hypothetical protein PEDI_08630 [Persicobacter diffluens]